MRKLSVIILCILFFVIGLFINPFNVYEEKKNKDKISELLADSSVSLNLFNTPLDSNYEVVNLNNNTFKIIMDDEKTFIIFIDREESILEVFEYKNSMRWFH